MADTKPIKTIIDHIGRTVVGVPLQKKILKLLHLYNPVIIHVQPDPQSGQLQVQSFPYIFMEFLKDKDKNNWTFYKTAISTSDVELDDRIITLSTKTLIILNRLFKKHPRKSRKSLNCLMKRN